VVFGGYAQLPYNRTQSQDFQWSPDSSRLLYCADESGITNVWEIGADGTNPRQLSANKDGGVRLFNPAWSPDSQRVAWLAYDPAQKSSSIWMLVDGQPQQIFHADVFVGLVGWSAGGQELIVKETQSRILPNNPVDVTLSAISTRDGKQREIARLPTTYFQNIKLAPARDQIAYVTRQEGSDSLFVMPAAGGAAKNILTSSDQRVYLAAIAWSADGRTIYFGKQSSWTLFSMIDNFK
jgi:Tol biopolymer transport system component